MPRRILNWIFLDVVKFLKKHSFVCSHVRGSHYYYVGKYAGEPRIVQVPFHGSKAFKPKTLKGIIKQSGIPLNAWLENRNKKK